MIAVVLLGFGGPECLDDVAPFLKNVTGRDLHEEQVKAAVERYRLIGGSSPFCSTSESQAGFVQTVLRQQYADLKVYLGLRYWNPLTSETIENVMKDKPEKIVLLCLTPYKSDITAQEYINTAIKEIRRYDKVVHVIEIVSWNKEPALIEGFAAALRTVLEQVKAPVIFTAHSLPQKAIDDGDPYAGEVVETVRLTAAAAGLIDYRVAWQSESRGGGEWLKPTVAEAIQEVKALGASEVIIMPIGFITDHMETLYDLDIVLKKQASEIGLAMERVSCLNDSPAVIEAMAAAISRAF